MRTYLLILLIALAACCINAQDNDGGSHEGGADGDQGGHEGRPDGDKGGHEGRPDGDRSGSHEGRPDGDRSGSHEGRPDGDWGSHEGRPDGDRPGSHEGRPDGDKEGHEGRWPDNDWGSHEGSDGDKHGWGEHGGSESSERRSKVAIVTFRILKDFNLIKDSMKEFEQVIRTSLVATTGMPHQLIKHMKLRPGSIIVEVYLKECREAAGKMTSYTDKITEVMSRGGLEFEFGNQMYQVEPQSLKIRHDYEHSAFHSMHHKKIIAVGVGAGGLLVLVSIVIGCCVYRKYRRGRPVPFTNLSKVSVSTPSLNEKPADLAFIKVPTMKDNWSNEKTDLGREPGVVVG